MVTPLFTERNDPYYMTHADQPRTFTNQLFERSIVPTEGQRILTLGVDPSLVVTWAQATGNSGAVAAIEHWLPDFRALEIAAQRVPSATLQTYFASDLTILEDQQFDICVIDCSSYASNRSLYQLTHAAANRLVVGGTIYAAGPKESGILPLTKRFETLFGNAEPLAYRKGQRIVVALRQGEIGPLAPEDMVTGTFNLDINGVEWELERNAGVFAKGEIDDATAMLVGAIDIEPNDRVLDLGCGSGILGMIAATMTPRYEAVLVDADADALAVTRRNCERNHITNVRIVPSDITDAITNERFTVVVCNPPFHQRGEPAVGLSKRFIRGARAVLQHDGRFYVVANRFLPYESRLAESFTTVTEVAGDERYKVLLAQGPRS